LNGLTVKLQDYRKEKNKYDNIVSIEMFKSVGIAQSKRPSFEVSAAMTYGIG
jgi:cyclopropane fatty-acyl-phospholipid synthase-like methyltransferase